MMLTAYWAAPIYLDFAGTLTYTSPNLYAAVVGVAAGWEASFLKGMHMPASKFAVCLFLFTVVLVAQSDRGTVTGAISDPAGAAVANAAIQLKNSETGVAYQAATTGTGNYTVAQIPVGTYEMSVEVHGFKKYVRSNIGVEVAQTVRLDVALEVGAATETVTVSEQASLLK